LQVFEILKLDERAYLWRLRVDDATLCYSRVHATRDAAYQSAYEGILVLRKIRPDAPILEGRWL